MNTIYSINNNNITNSINKNNNLYLIKTILTITILIILTSNTTQIEFKVVPSYQHCFLEEFFSTSHPLIKYKITGLENHEKETRNILSNLSISVIHQEKNHNCHTENPKTVKGKFIPGIYYNGVHKVCVKFFSGYWSARVKINMSLRIVSESTEQPNLLDAIKSKDIKTLLHDRVNKIIKKSDRLIASKKVELSLEEEDASKIISTQWNFIYFTSVQIIVIIVLFVYQIVWFKRILEKLQL